MIVGRLIWCNIVIRYPVSSLTLIQCPGFRAAIIALSKPGFSAGESTWDDAILMNQKFFYLKN